MLLCRPSLYGHIESWRRHIVQGGSNIVTLASGIITVHGGQEITELLSATDRWVPQSPFLRTRTHSPLPTAIRKGITRDFLAALHQAPLQWDSALAALRGVAFQAPSWGTLFMRRLFGPVITGQQAAITGPIDEFIARKTLQDDLLGSYFRLDAESGSKLQRRLGEYVDLVGAECPHDTIPSIVTRHIPHLTVQERGELYARMTQSLITFLGTVLELTLWGLAERTSPGSRSASLTDLTCDEEELALHVYETMRLYPATWRLVRTAQSDFSYCGLHVAKGTDIVLSIATLHTHPEVWQNPMQYNHLRWQHPETISRKYYLPFGHGPLACPGRNASLAVLPQAVSQVINAYSLRLTYQGLTKKPYTRSLLCPPRHLIRFQPRQRSL